MSSDCDKECWSYLAVMKMSFSLVLFHLIMMLFTIRIRSSRNPRAHIHNHWWLVKFAGWLLLTVAAFYIDNQFYANYHVAAIIFSALFILLQSLLLVDFAWQWAQRWIDLFDETSDKWYRNMLICTCFILYALSFAVSIFLLVIMSSGQQLPGSCQMNITFVSVNLVLNVIQSVMAILPQVQDATPRSGLFQSAVLTAYTTYLVASSVSSQPSQSLCQLSYFSVDPHSDESAVENGFSSGMTTVGVIFTYLALGYSAFSSGSTTFFENIDYSASSGYSQIPTETPGDGDNNDDETEAVKYGYPFFHLTFLMAAFYMSMVLTDWEIMVRDPASDGGVIIIHGAAAVWAKVSMSWACILLYVWTLVAPIILPDRDFSF